jgi:hypothetical protein
MLTQIINVTIFKGFNLLFITSQLNENQKIQTPERQLINNLIP